MPLLPVLHALPSPYIHIQETWYYLLNPQTEFQYQNCYFRYEHLPHSAFQRRKSRSFCFLPYPEETCFPPLQMLQRKLSDLSYNAHRGHHQVRDLFWKMIWYVYPGQKSDLHDVHIHQGTSHHSLF